MMSVFWSQCNLFFYSCFLLRIPMYVFIAIKIFHVFTQYFKQTNKHKNKKVTKHENFQFCNCIMAKCRRLWQRGCQTFLFHCFYYLITIELPVSVKWKHITYNNTNCWDILLETKESQYVLKVLGRSVAIVTLIYNQCLCQHCWQQIDSFINNDYHLYWKGKRFVQFAFKQKHLKYLRMKHSIHNGYHHRDVWLQALVSVYRNQHMWRGHSYFCFKLCICFGWYFAIDCVFLMKRKYHFLTICLLNKNETNTIYKQRNI